MITFNGGICCWLKSCFFELVFCCPPTAETKSGLRGKTLVEEKETLHKTSIVDLLCKIFCPASSTKTGMNLCHPVCKMWKQDVSCWQKLWLRTNVIHVIQLVRALMEQEGCRDAICDHRKDSKPLNCCQHPWFVMPSILNICRLQFSTL